MARIVGDLRPEDDYTHPLGDESNFNESMYFNFFDRDQSIGGWLRIGNRANEGHAEMSVCIYLPDGRVLFMFQRPEIASNDAFDAAGLRFEVIEPSDKLRTAYKGPVVELSEPRAMADPRKAFKENPWKEIAFDLVHEAVGPMYGKAKNTREADTPAEEQFAAAHYEQHMKVTGRIELEGKTISINGLGLRDHSWGPRYWQAINKYKWLTMNFGEDFGAMVMMIQRDAEGKNMIIGGVVVRGDEVDDISEVEVEATYEDNGLYHTGLVAKVKTGKGEELRIEGDVKGFIPLRNRRQGRTTNIGEGMTEWRCGDRVGYGMSEFLTQSE